MGLKKRLSLKKIFFVFIFFVSFSIGGCMSKSQYYFSKGDHAEMIREFGSKGDIQQLNSIDLYYVCPSYLAMRKYQKSLQCATELENRDKGVVNALGQIFSPRLFKIKAYLIKLQAYLDTGDFPRAVEYGEKAYNLAEQGGFSMFTNTDAEGINIIGDLGVAYAVSGNDKKALEMLHKLDKYSMSILRGYVFELYRQLQRIRIAVAMKNYDIALSIYNQNEGIFEGKWWSNLPGHRFTYSKLIMNFMQAKSYYESGNISKAEEYYTLMLKTPNISESSDIYYFSLAALGAIRLRQARYSEGIELLCKAVEEVELQRSTIGTESAKIGFFGDKQTVYKTLIGALFAQGQYKHAFEYVERSKARALVDLLASNKDIAVKESGVQASSMLKELETIETEGKALDVSSLAANKINERNTRSVQIKEKIKTTAPELASLITVSTPPTAEIQSYIGGDKTLVEYYYHGEDIYAFVLTKNELKAAKLDGKDLANDIGQFRKSLQDPKSTRYLDHSQKLYQRLIKPVEHFINTTKLIIVPHGILHYLPFNALHGGNNYLIDKYSVSYLPSSSIMKFLKQRKTQEAKNALIFGNPDLGDPKYDLKYAEEEAVTISKGFPHAKVLIRKEATKTAFKKFGSQFDYIHFATHGQFESDAPLNSGLFLAKDSGNDGVLSVNELYSIRLNADLITLSACETALGKINPGDDVVGLTRGFLFAGSSSIVASLWKVDDMATAQLMTEFYSNLRKTNKRDALRDAQLNIKKQNEHPYFWAAFQLTGNAQ